MRQFKLFSLWFFLSLIFVSLSVLFPLIAGAATVGFYAGTFDPPTQAEMGIVRCALGDASVHKECQDIGKTISRVVVVVNQAGDEDPLASTRERVLMVKKGLQTYGDRVEIVTGPETARKKRDPCSVIETLNNSSGSSMKILTRSRDLLRLIKIHDSYGS